MKNSVLNTIIIILVGAVIGLGTYVLFYGDKKTNQQVRPTPTESIKPTEIPSPTPTITPSVSPTINPTVTPTVTPTVIPTINPTVTPTVKPTITPTPTVKPTVTPTKTPAPTVKPTVTPTPTKTSTPTIKPTITPTPTKTSTPTVKPTIKPTVTPTPTKTPTPTVKPTVTPTPTKAPTPTPEYTVKYYGSSFVETNLTSVTLAGSSSVPVQQSGVLSLGTNTLYVVSFDYKTQGGTNKFNIDLYPDSLPEKVLTATTTNQHYDWEVSSNNNDIKSSRLRFFDNQQESNEQDIVITNILMGIVKSETKKKDTTLGTLPTPTRSGYKFLGWYTSSTGGSLVSSSTKVTGNMTLYPHWEKTSKVLPDTFVVPSGYTNDVGKSYISDTLKYKTIKSNNYTRYYSLIWVKDANRQLNAANNGLNGGNRVTILSKEVKDMNYTSKGMIATNGSFTWNSRANIPVIATKGNLVTNDKYVKQKSDGTSLVYATLTLGKNNLLTYKTTSDANESRNWLTSIGARNTWAITHFETSNFSGGTDGGADYRSSICQIDENNFVLYTGRSSGIHDYMKELHDLFGCKTVVNLDGGGSSGMYYKTKSMSDIGTVYQYKNPAECCGASCNYKCRSISDMLYFVE